MTDKFKFGENTYRLQTPMQTQDVLAQIDALLEGRQFSSVDEDRPGAILQKTPFAQLCEGTPYEEEYGPKADCDCCGKYAPLTFSVSFGIDTWACEECRGNPEPHVSPITEPRSFVAEMERIWLVNEKAKNNAR